MVGTVTGMWKSARAVGYKRLFANVRPHITLRGCSVFWYGDVAEQLPAWWRHIDG